MKLRVLMYHSVTTEKESPLVVSVDRLRDQFTMIKKWGCSTVSCNDIISWQNGITTPPHRPVLITFDDAYLETYTLALPLLEEFNFKATVFVPGKHVGGENAWDGGGQAIMNLDQLRDGATRGLEPALHGWDHRSFEDLSDEELREQILNGINQFTEAEIPFAPAVAYPFGANRRKTPDRHASMVKTLRETGVQLGFRIGARTNTIPMDNLFTIQRANIRGIDASWEFPVKLLLGRSKPF